MFNDCSTVQYPGLGLVRLRHALAGAFAVLALASAGGAGAATEVLYYFVDDRGTPHFSNVPMDKRYRPFAQVSVAPRTPAFDDGNSPPPYEGDPSQVMEDASLAHDAVHDDTIHTEMSQEHLPVDVQEH